VGGTDHNIQENVMFVKSLIAVAAVASVVSFASTSAKADTNIDFGIGFGVGGFYPGDGYPSDYPDVYVDDMPHRFHHRRHRFHDYAPVRDYGVSCNTGRNIVRRAGFNSVRAYDCSAPTYGYKAWRDGDLFQVKVNYQGDIISARPIY
jgi:hypothetical protein